MSPCFKRWPMWQISTKHHYKIWFSKNVDVFLDKENQERFIKASSDNPHLHFSFIFSSNCLSAKTLDDLQRFCDKHHITPIDFDKEIPPLLRSDKDKALYNLAKKEIEFAKDNGGNLAGASDCVRAIIAVIERCRIYSDFDVELKFADIDLVITSTAPVLLSVEFVSEACIKQPCLNNECLVVSFDPNNPSHLSKEAFEKMSLVADSIIHRYANPLDALTKHPVKGLIIELSDDQKKFIELFFKENPHADIFAFRRYVLALTIEEYCRVKIKCLDKNEQGEPIGVSSDGSMENRYTQFLEQNKLSFLLWRVHADPDFKFSTKEILAKKLELLKHDLYVFSVTLISGPINYYAMYQETVPQKGFSAQGHAFSAIMTPPLLWENFCEVFKRAALSENGLEKVFKSKNTFALKVKEARDPTDPLALVKPICDLSWTPLGELEKAKRLQDRDKAVAIKAVKQNEEKLINSKGSGRNATVT